MASSVSDILPLFVFLHISSSYDCNYCRFIGTSGDNVDNMYCCTEGMDSLQLLERSLLSSHIAPTGPDVLCKIINNCIYVSFYLILGCYPFSSNDPFIITDCPHIYFAGNQPEFQSKSITGSCFIVCHRRKNIWSIYSLLLGDDGQKVLLISVPSFDASHCVVLVNLKTLSCEPLSLHTSSTSSAKKQTKETNSNNNINETIGAELQDIDSEED